MVDTTGSTEAFIGALVYGLVQQPQMQLGPMLQLACYAAAQSWRGDGARGGLLTAEQVPSGLLYPDLL